MTTSRYAVATTGSRQDDRPRDGEFVLVELLDPDADELAALDSDLGLPPESSAMVAGPHLRARLDVHGGCLSMALHAARLDPGTREVETDELVVVVSPTAAAVVVRGAGEVLPDLRRRLAEGTSGPAGVLQAVLDVLVPDYDDVLVGLDEQVGEVEARVFSPERGDHTQQIYLLKRELLELRRAVVPLVDVLQRLAGEPSLPVPADAQPGLHDLRARVTRTAEAVGHLDGLIDSALDAQLAQIGVRQNEDQRKISAWAAIALVPTVVGGVYGMNFQNMPELRWEYGYFAALGVIASACVALFLGFRRNGWL